MYGMAQKYLRVLKKNENVMNKMFKFYKYPKCLQRNTIFNYESQGGAERLDDF